MAVEGRMRADYAARGDQPVGMWVARWGSSYTSVCIRRTHGAPVWTLLSFVCRRRHVYAFQSILTELEV